MKHLFVTLTGLTLILPVTLQAGAQQNQPAGGGNACSPQHVNTANGMSEADNLGLDPGIDRQGSGDPRMQRRTSPSLDQDIPGGGQGNAPADFAERRARMMRRFDTNGDGVLDDNERAKMRAFMQERRQQIQNRTIGGEGGGRGGWGGGTTTGPNGSSFPQQRSPGVPPDVQ